MAASRSKPPVEMKETGTHEAAELATSKGGARCDDKLLDEN